MVKWTKDQKKAIEERKCNLLISAAAGSGKTAVLVERIIQLLTQDKIDIDKLLIVTFTNAAAGEMRERIANAISKELEKKDSDKIHLRKQINLLNKASISTIHSFCIDVVRKNFHLINVDPNFRIGDITETSILKGESLEEIFEKEYKEENEEFVDLVERFGGNREDIPLQEMVLNLYEFIQSQPYPRKWLKEKVEEFNDIVGNLENNSWYKEIVNEMSISLNSAKEVFIEALDISKRPMGPYTYKEALEYDLIITDELIQASKISLEYFYSKLIDLKHKSLSRKKIEDLDENLKAECKDLRDQGKDLIKAIKTNLLTKNPKEYEEEIQELYPAMSYLYKLVCDFEDLYKVKKNEKNIVDFNDLEHYGLEVLSHAQVANVYKEKFEYIFVDEYQDSNIVQETLLGFIKREDNMFMVGDVKQSIYRFRLADPSLFINKYESFNSKEDMQNKRIDLSKNFRSRKEVIDGINYIFKNIMSKSLGEIDYDESAYLYEGFEKKSIDNPHIEVNIIDKKAEVEVSDDIEELEYAQIESKIVATRIKELLKEEIYDYKKEEYRKIDYSDIVILLRTTRNWATSYMEALMEEGIPVYADTNSGYFETLEIDLFMNFLKVIDNKRQDIPLLSVMKSHIGKFNIEELIKIRTYNKKVSFYDVITLYCNEVEDELSKKCSRFIDNLNSWKYEAMYIPIDKLIDKLYIDTNYFNYVGAMPRGIQRQANLRMLIDKARQFENTTIKGLFNFIKYIEKLKSSSGDLGEAKSLSENDNVVRIMSIHKSKGLEFPVVFVGAMGKQFNLRDTSKQLLIHKELGLGPKYVNPHMRIETDTLAKIAMKGKIKRESLSEEMRVLYVALTRAKDKLILIGGINNLDKTMSKWKRPQNISNLLKGSSYMDWVGPLLLRHESLTDLRESLDVKTISDESLWKVNFLTKKNVELEEENKILLRDNLINMIKEYEDKKEENRSRVENNLNWSYGYNAESQIPSKISVSEIKKISVEGMDNLNIPTLIKNPKFMETKSSLTPAQRGVIIHKVMQYINFSRVDSLNYVEDIIKEMVEREILREDEASVVDSLKVFNFFQSSVGKRCTKSLNVKKETPFNLVISASQVVDESANEDILVQGIIDCYFEEEDGIVLIDYKSDYIKNHEKEVISKYKAQLDMYEKALETILKKKVKEKIIYSFYLDKEIKVG